MASEETIAQLRSIAKDKGFDLSGLKPVVRVLPGCAAAAFNSRDELREEKLKRGRGRRTHRV